MFLTPYEYTKRSNPQQKRKGVPWNEREVRDVWNMVHRTPAFASQIHKMQAMTMCKPFTLHIDGVPQEMDDAMQYLAETDWMKTVKDIFLWKLCFGIVPYFEDDIEQTAHRVPRVPCFGTGAVYTYESEKHKQVFEWHWNEDDITRGKRKTPPPIHWLYTGREPGLDGKLRSVAISCLDMYDAVQKTQSDALYASYHRARPMIIYEDAPPKTNRDEKYEHTQFDMYGGDVVQQYMNEQEHRDDARIRTLRSDEVEENLYRAGILNEAQVRNKVRQPTLECKGVEHDIEREIFVHNNVSLPADRKLAGRVEPAILWDPLKVRQELASQAAEIVGIPLELTQSQSKVHASNHAGMMQSMGEVLKEHISWLNVALTRMYRNIYGKTIQNGWDLLRRNGEPRLYPKTRFRSDDARIRYEIETANNVTIDIHLQCDPRVTGNTVLTLYAQNFMTKKNAADQLTRITGLSEGIVQALVDKKKVETPKKRQTLDDDDDKEEEEEVVDPKRLKIQDKI